MSEEVEVQNSGTEITNAAPESAPSPEKTVEVSSSAEKVPVVEAPSYTPNFKFKVHDQEKEFDEFLRGSIKDVDTEKKARELYEKAYGLDHVKPKYEELKKKYPEVEGQYHQLNNTVNEILDLKDKDLGSFFAALKLPEEKVAQWMLDKIKKMELPPEQRQVYDNYEETRRRNIALEKQFQDLERQSQQQSVQARTFELEQSLHRPEVSSFVQAFDAARKTPGAFKEEVRERGLYEWKVNGKDISVDEAISMTMSRYTGMVNPAEMGTVTAQPSLEKPLPVIPRVSGKAVSATGKQIRSIEDLKKRSAELAG